MSSPNHTGRVAVVTGASSGIGEATARALSAAGGDIVNVSSVAGRTARPTNGVYAATKFGLGGWSDSIRQELLPDVRVTVIEPGAVETELVTHLTHEATKRGVEQLYATSALTADDVAKIITFAVTRPRRVSLNEILVRPAGQA